MQQFVVAAANLPMQLCIECQAAVIRAQLYTQMLSQSLAHDVQYPKPVKWGLAQID